MLWNIWCSSVPLCCKTNIQQFENTPVEQAVGVCRALHGLETPRYFQSKPVLIGSACAFMTSCPHSMSHSDCHCASPCLLPLTHDAFTQAESGFAILLRLAFRFSRQREVCLSNFLWAAVAQLQDHLWISSLLDLTSACRGDFRSSDITALFMLADHVISLVGKLEATTFPTAASNTLQNKAKVFDLFIKLQNLFL